MQSLQQLVQFKNEINIIKRRRRKEAAASTTSS